MNSRILFISDLHFPYAHEDVLPFLKALKSKYRPDRVVCSGDELDYHAINFHEHNPDLPSPGKELDEAIAACQPLYRLFPQMDILESNHGSLVYRKALLTGLPRSVIKNYREILGAPLGWKWHEHLILKAPLGPIYFCHGKSADVLKLSQSMGMSCVQGHFHERFELRYWGNPLGLYFAMTAGCLIDNKALCFAYNKLNLKRPVIGCAVIIDGLPKLLPMILNKSGRWIGDVP